LGQGKGQEPTPEEFHSGKPVRLAGVIDYSFNTSSVKEKKFYNLAKML
jgi:hypothetical protein